MASLREIKRRIKSVENIHGITKAMQIISAVRYKKIETRYKKSLVYYQSLERLLARLIASGAHKEHPLFKTRKVKKELLIFMTADRGLCGGFNTVLIKELLRYLDQHKGRSIDIYPIGKVGSNFVSKCGFNSKDAWINIGYQFTSADIAEKVNMIRRKFEKGVYDKVSILATQMNPSGFQKPVIEDFLNLEYLKNLNEEIKDSDLEYIFEPDKEEVLSSLTELFVQQRFFILILRSIAAEYFSRMVAMKQATDNGKEVIDDLTLERNKIRQAMITREISEIIGGVNALSG